MERGEEPLSLCVRLVNNFSSVRMVLQKHIPESSSGRTKDSGSFNGGSNPSSGVFYWISCIVPLVSHVDHTIHEIHALITEQGVADLRGLDPIERAKTIIENCAHPKFKQELYDYLNKAINTCEYKEIPVIIEDAYKFPNI